MLPLIIINNTAAKARQAWPNVQAELKKKGIRFESYQTTRAGDATGRTRKALSEGHELVAVIGGDGTLSEVV